MEVIYSIENFEDSRGTNEINSPRSLEACLRLGLDPNDLKPKPRSHFMSKEYTSEMVDIKCNYFERKRLERIEAVKSERNAIITFNAKRSGRTVDVPLRISTATAEQVATANAERTSRLLEMEAKRFEALKRRQEKELSQIIEKEEGLVELQLKIQRGEQEERQRQLEHQRKVAAQKIEEEKKRIQRQQELKKLEEEEAARRKAIQRKENEFDRKMKLTRKEEEKRILREARERDLERLRVIEESKRKTDELIQRQLDIADESRRIMLEREQRVRDQLQRKKEAKAIEIQEQRDKAAKRIYDALQTHHKLQLDKKLNFDKRQNEALERAKEKAIIDHEIIRKRMEEREKLEHDRIRRLIDSYKFREDYRNSVVKRREDRDHGYANIKQDIDQKVAKLKFSLSLRMEDKIENVERIARMKEFQRLQTLKRIEDDDMNYERLLEEKEAILRRHREELKVALIRKHQITAAMEEMKVTNDYTLLNKLFAEKGKKSRMNGKGIDEDDVTNMNVTRPITS